MAIIHGQKGGGVSLPSEILAGDTVLHARVGSFGVGSKIYANTAAGFTAVRAGTYRITYSLRTGDPANVAYAQLTKNGVSVANSEIVSNVYYSAIKKIIDVACLAGDVIRLQQKNPGTTTPSVTDYFMVSILADSLQGEISKAITIL